jgi:hypothetical protein
MSFNFSFVFIFRENESNRGKLKNQILLEEDNNAVKNKVKALEAIVAKVQIQEATLRTLQSEKEEWTSMFKEVLSGKCKPSDLTPVAAIRHLRYSYISCTNTNLISRSDGINSAVLYKKVLLFYLENNQNSNQKIQF